MVCFPLAARLPRGPASGHRGRGDELACVVSIVHGASARPADGAPKAKLLGQRALHRRPVGCSGDGRAARCKSCLVRPSLRSTLRAIRAARRPSTSWRAVRRPTPRSRQRRSLRPPSARSRARQCPRSDRTSKSAQTLWRAATRGPAQAACPGGSGSRCEPRATVAAASRGLRTRAHSTSPSPGHRRRAYRPPANAYPDPTDAGRESRHGLCPTVEFVLECW